MYAPTIKDIRSGKWSVNAVNEFIEELETRIEDAKSRSVIPERSDEQKIRQVLRECIEMQYGKKL